MPTLLSDKPSSEASARVLVGPDQGIILVNGTRRIATKRLPGLPYGLRVAIIHTPLHGSPDRWALSPSGHRPLSLSTPGEAHRRIARLWSRLVSRLQSPRHLARRAMPARGLRAHEGHRRVGHVATAIRPYPAPIVGRGFLSCLDTEYYLPGRSLRAAVLLDAADPGRIAPAAIPGLIPRPCNRDVPLR